MIRSAAALVTLLAAVPAIAGAARWHLIWSDDFNGPTGSAPDPGKWAFDSGDGGWGNRELETYTKEPANVHVDGQGHLVIRAVRDDAGNYTSARIKTQGRFSARYGRFEARMKIPRGQGIWPAFWMLGADIEKVGWPACGEIDIMENIGKEPSIVHGTLHGPGYSGGQAISHAAQLPSHAPLADDYHIYALEWTPKKVVFLVDGRPYTEVTPKSLPKSGKWVYDHPFFILLNLAVGGAWPGNPDASTLFPQELSVDWVRVYQSGKAH